MEENANIFSEISPEYFSHALIIFLVILILMSIILGIGLHIYSKSQSKKALCYSTGAVCFIFIICLVAFIQWEKLSDFDIDILTKTVYAEEIVDRF